MKAWQEALGSRVLRREPVGGGCINKAYHCQLEDGREVFIKSQPGCDAELFALEARGLAWLAEADALPTPAVIALGDDFLVLEYLPSGRRARDFDERLGRGLARVHKSGAPHFGWERENFLATLRQDNRLCSSWRQFYFERRVQPLVVGGVDRGLAPPGWLRDLERLEARLDEILGPDELPSRLHGDLWSGNIHVNGAGEPVLIDPAVYGGHREIDLAMLELFGSPGPKFYEAYDEVFPLAPGLQERRSLYQLYPLLVHLHLFGGGYLSACESALTRYL